MITVIEGGDGSGKSTLCKRLQNQGYTLLEFEQGVNFDEWVYYLNKYHNENVIVDRSFLSDLVYRLLDKKPRRGMDLMSMCVILKQIKIIHCETDTMYEDSLLRGEDNITVRKDSDKIKEYYATIFDMLRIFLDVQILNYNWQKDDIINVIAFIGEPNYGPV